MGREGRQDKLGEGRGDDRTPTSITALQRALRITCMLTLRVRRMACWGLILKVSSVMMPRRPTETPAGRRRGTGVGRR